MRLTWIVVVALVRAVCAGPVTAQDSQVAPGGLELGLGLGAADQGLGALATVGLNTTIGDFLVRGSASEDFTIFGGPSESSWDVAFLYGRTFRGDTNWLRVAAGPALAHTDRDGDPIECFIFCAYEKLRSNTLGAALQADGVWAFSRFFGLGIGAFADLNGDNPFGGITLGLHLGRLR